jgi:hypothetical protein
MMEGPQVVLAQREVFNKRNSEQEDSSAGFQR